jgi:chromosome partitioning protein
MAAGNPSESRVLALLSQKGGSGKTTLAAHLAVALGVSAARRVVLVDTDPQRSAAAWWRARGRETPELVEAPAGEIIGTVRRIRASGGGGLIVVDTMPSVAADIASIARAADYVLIPCRPSILDLKAIGGTVAVVKDARTAAAIVLNAAPAPRGAGEASVTHEARSALRQYGLPILPLVVGQRAVLAHALAAGLAVEEFEPQSKAAAEIRLLARTMEERLWHDAPISQPST